MILRRRRFRDVVHRQLALFAEEDADLLEEVEDALERYDAGEREEAEELYGDYLLTVEACAEQLAEVRDAYAARLAPADADAYCEAFERAVADRWPGLAAAVRDA